jgi:hypothetical protein
MAASVLLLSSRITAQNPSSKLDLDGGFSRKSSGSVHFLRPSIWKNNNAVKVSCAISKDNGNAVSVADSVPTVTRSKSVFNSNSSSIFVIFQFLFLFCSGLVLLLHVKITFFFFFGGGGGCVCLCYCGYIYKEVSFSIGFQLKLKGLSFFPCFVSSFVEFSGVHVLYLVKNGNLIKILISFVL